LQNEATETLADGLPEWAENEDKDERDLIMNDQRYINQDQSNKLMRPSSPRLRRTMAYARGLERVMGSQNVIATMFIVKCCQKAENWRLTRGCDIRFLTFGVAQF